MQGNQQPWNQAANDGARGGLASKPASRPSEGAYPTTSSAGQVVTPLTHNTSLDRLSATIYAMNTTRMTYHSDLFNPSRALMQYSHFKSLSSNFYHAIHYGGFIHLHEK